MRKAVVDYLSSASIFRRKKILCPTCYFKLATCMGYFHHGDTESTELNQSLTADEHG
jgi:hypothetical protein